jgi:hypothetical protein
MFLVHNMKSTMLSIHAYLMYPVAITKSVSNHVCACAARDGENMVTTG